ncbi:MULTISPECIES: hypothetical protein [Olivibacter]|jgi:hypothetical protein|uniref:Uncharacterized protein n=3 Tax=Sphingobacteriaceae TaxID=84566 RepID=F4C5N1_SPHS2|nr:MULTISPECIES: hypothetical protein [Olivibacter]MCL4637433.1 hypothetical protein [Olivibacter sp. UJ_SKK_5.1]MDM8175156.1 hypothetical protein [Olivibacter sp. 47]MDX3913167.1 hypothetical protein [Pseudosphingobacterium sp.]
MSERSKKIFLYICIIVPFLGYCIFYYSNMIKNAPFRFSDFESVEFNYGTPDHMLNKYNSKTQEYQYMNRRDSLVKSTLKLRKDDLLYLHRKATEYGFWNFPDDMTNKAAGVDTTKNVVRFFLKFNYKEKSKQMLFDSNFDGDPKLTEAAKTMVSEVRRILTDAEDRN